MIFKLLVVDKTGKITRRMEGIFTRFMKDYHLYRVEDLDSVISMGRKEGIDVIIINGDDFKDLSGMMLSDFKSRIRPSPKILLLLEPNLINTNPLIESEVHKVIDSSNFRMLQLQKAVYDLIRDRFMEEFKRREAEDQRKKSQTEELLDEILELQEDLERKQIEEGEG